MGAALALEARSQAIAAAQSQARAALQRAGDTTDASARPDNAFASSQASAVAALPAAATPAQGPTPSLPPRARTHPVEPAPLEPGDLTEKAP